MLNLDHVLCSIANAFVSMVGNGFDPEGSKLPEFRTRKPPSVEIPKAEKKKAPSAVEDIYTDEEIEAMSDVEFAIKVGGAKTKEAFYQAKTPAKPRNVIEFDDHDMHGITPREYGEMLAYTPILNDLALAGKVKRGKEVGKSLKAIAKEIGETYQTVRHYSAAIGRAQNQ